jgi:trimethylamine:corrinoid methyltransferase-like protein
LNGRLAKPEASKAPIRPELNGGRLKPLSEQEVGAIATAAIKVLERIGMDEAPKVVMARAYLPEAVDAEIRRRHPILLPREVMG